MSGGLRHHNDEENGPSMRLDTNRRSEVVTFLKATSAYALWGNVCLTYKNQKPKSLDTADVVRDVVNRRGC
jgi:hypothetical protein